MKFSVLMAVYYKDDPNSFSEALKSIYQQTISASEIILVVDGKIGNDLEEIINKFSSRMNLNVIRLVENLGLPGALNEGVKHIKTEWTFRFDSDDLNMVDRFEKQIRFIETNRVDVLGGQIEEFDDNGIIGRRDVPLSHSEMFKRLPFRNPLNHVTVAVKTDLLIKFGYRDVQFFEDYDLWYRLFYEKDLIVRNMADVLVKVRAGKNMINRRSGFYYAYAELRFRIITHHKSQYKLAHWMAGIIRIFLSIVPVKVRGFIYQKKLRTPVH